MKTCERCGLPAPLTTEHCALCQKPFRAASATSYRLAASGKRYRWLIKGEEAAVASLRSGTWDITDAATNRVDVTIIAVEVDGGERVAIVDHRGRTAATYTPASTPGASEPAGVGIVRDSHGAPMLVVRGDGPTGLHVTDLDGNVLLMAGPADDGDGDGDGLDVLVTRGGAEHRRMLLGLTLAIELLRAGRLRTAA